MHSRAPGFLLGTLAFCPSGIAPGIIVGELPGKEGGTGRFAAAGIGGGEITGPGSGIDLVALAATDNSNSTEATGTTDLGVVITSNTVVGPSTSSDDEITGGGEGNGGATAGIAKDAVGAIGTSEGAISIARAATGLGADGGGD